MRSKNWWNKNLVWILKEPNCKWQKGQGTPSARSKNAEQKMVEQKFGGDPQGP